MRVGAGMRPTSSRAVRSIWPEDMSMRIVSLYAAACSLREVEVSTSGRITLAPVLPIEAASTCCLTTGSLIQDDREARRACSLTLISIGRLQSFPARSNVTLTERVVELGF